MNPFALARPGSFKEAAALAVDTRFALPVLKAGGMDVLDHVKEGLLAPDVLIDVRPLRSEGSPGAVVLDAASGVLRVEASTTLAELARTVTPVEAPAVAQACASAATPQVRNVATVAGNLLQRPRCWYYRNQRFDCLKKGGATCYSVDGENRYHAIFGDGPCHIVHPSNLAVALWVCDAVVHLTGGGRDALRIGELFHMPDRGVRSEHNLEPGEVVTHVTFSPARASAFYSIKEKQSFDWPLVMAAAALELDGDTIRSARLCAGAVAPVPWALPRVEAALKGVRVSDGAALAKACAIAAEGAKPMTDNAYKVRLLPVALARCIRKAAGVMPEGLS